MDPSPLNPRNDPPRLTSAGELPADLDELFRKAEEARQKQIWEFAIRAYQSGIRKRPETISAWHIGLGRAYEGKSRDKDSSAFLVLALEQYRIAVRTDARRQDAHDALLAAASKAGRLDELLDEYKLLLSQDPSNDVYRSTLRKIQALLVLGVKKGPAAPQPHRLTRFVLEWGFPFAGFTLFVGSYFVRAQPVFHALRSLDVLMKRSGAFFLLAYLFYKIFLLLRARN